MYTTISIHNPKTMKTVNKFIASLNQEVEYHVGENEEDNFHVIDSASPDDMWFHIDGYSSGHIIAKIDSMKLDKKIFAKSLHRGVYYVKKCLGILTSKILE